MDMTIAVDIGGTQIRVAVYPRGEHRPVKQKRIPTRTADEQPLDRVIALIAELWPVNDRVCSIGVAVPGWINHNLGVVYVAPNIPGWEKLALGPILGDRFGVPVKLGNDANLAAVGEWRFGAGRKHHNLIYMTISTGIGGGVIADDRLLLGANGLATELGHVTIMPDGPVCGCGHRGHLEALGSGTAIANYVSEQLAKGVPSSLSSIAQPRGRDISMAAEQGDPLAKAALTRAGKFVGLGLANYLHIFNPSIIIIGGGVSRSGPLFFEPMRASLAEHVLSPEYMQGLMITTAALGDDAGLMGALAYAEISNDN